MKFAMATGVFALQARIKSVHQQRAVVGGFAALGYWGEKPLRQATSCRPRASLMVPRNYLSVRTLRSRCVLFWFFNHLTIDGIVN